MCVRGGILLLAFACGVPGLAQTGAAGTGSVAGHVFCADTQTPCRFAGVTLQVVPSAAAVTGGRARQSGGHGLIGSTDLSGAFQIDRVPPGEYYLVAREAGYLTPFDVFRSEQPDAKPTSTEVLDPYLTRITVQAGKTTQANQTLERGAALGGVVRYDDGGVAVSLPVQILRKGQDGGWHPFVNSGGDTGLAPLGMGRATDNRGRFVEPALPPGVYAVEVRLPDAAVVPVTIFDRPSLDVIVKSGDALQVYSGNKLRLSEAVGVELKQGEERTDLEVTIPTTGLHTVRGVVTAGATGAEVANGSVKLIDPADKTVLREMTFQQGEFALNYVPDGTYLLAVTGQGAGDRAEHAVRYAPLEMSLEVQGDLPDLHVSLPAAK